MFEARDYIKPKSAEQKKLAAELKIVESKIDDHLHEYRNKGEQSEPRVVPVDDVEFLSLLKQRRNLRDLMRLR